MQSTDIAWAKEPIFDKLYNTIGPNIEDTMSLHLQFGVAKLTKDSFIEILEKLNAGIDNEDLIKLAEQLADKETERINIKQFYKYYGELYIQSLMEEVRKAVAEGFFDICEVFEEYNKDFISLLQFELGLHKISAKLTKEQIKILFNEHDEAKTGMMTYRHFANSLEEYSLSKSPITKDDPHFSTIRKIRLYIKTHSTNTMALLFKDLIRSNLEGKYWITKKDFREALSNMLINLDNTQFESLTEFLDPRNAEQIDYDYFCQVVGYIQPAENDKVEESKFSAIPTESHIVDSSSMIKKMINEIAISVKKGKYDLQRMFKERDEEKNGTVSRINFINIIRTVREGLEYNNFEITALCNHFQDPDTHDIQYNGFLSQVDQVLNVSKEKPIRANLQWANKILDEICIYLHYKYQTSYEYFKAYGLNPDNKSVPLESFEEGIRAMNIEITEGELNRLKQDLDTDNDQTISAEEFAVHLDKRKEQALQRYEKKVVAKVRDYVKTKSVNLRALMQKYDQYNTKHISSDDFKNELYSQFKGLLTEQEYNFLVIKYEVERGKVGYMELVKDVAGEESEIDIKKKEMELVYKLRENIRSLNIKAISHLESIRSSDNTYSTSVLLKIFPRSILSMEEYSIVVKIIDKTKTNRFKFEDFRELFWTDAAEENEREDSVNSAKRLSKNIRTYCKNKNINLKQKFEEQDTENDGYLSVDSIKDIFFKVGLKFSFKQLSCLLYNQNIATNDKYFKNYAELLQNINEETSLDASIDNILAETLKDKKRPKTSGVKQPPSSTMEFVPAKTKTEDGKSISEIEEEQSVVLETKPKATEQQKVKEFEDEKIMSQKQFPTPIEVQLEEDMIKYLAEQFEVLRKYLKGKKVDTRSEFSKHEIDGSIDFNVFCQVLDSHGVDLDDQTVLNAFYSYLKEDKEGKISTKRLYDALLRGKVLSQYKKPKEEAKTIGIGIKRLAKHMEENDISLNNLKKFMLGGGSLRKELLSKTLTSIDYPFTQAELNMLFKSICVKDNAIGSVGHLLTLVNEEHAKKNPKVLQPSNESKETLAELNKEIEGKKLTEGNLQKMLNINGDGYVHDNDFPSIFIQANFKTPVGKLNKLFADLDIYNTTVLSCEFLLKQIIGTTQTSREQISSLPIDEQLSTEAEKLFIELDKHPDGSLTEEDFYKAVVASSHNKCTRENIKELMRQLAVNQNNTISKEVFMKYMETRIKNDIMSAEDEMIDLKEQLNEYDFNGNGYLNSNDLYSILLKDYPAIKKSDLEEIFEELDPSKEGKIDISEFIDYIRNPVRQAQLDKNTGKYRVILMMKHKRRLSPIEYFNYFKNLSNTMLYKPSFISQLHSIGKNLPSESFKVTRNPSGLGYVDIELNTTTDNKPINTLKEIIPGIAGYIIFNSAVGVPISDPNILKRENILNRAIKVLFYHNDHRQYLYGSALVLPGWNANEEHVWTFNSIGKVGTNPLVFKWKDMSIKKDICVVFEFVSSIK